MSSPAVVGSDSGAIAALIAAPRDPAKILVSGGIGAGKTTLLGAVRRALRDAGVPVRSSPDDETGAALVVDDAQLLSEGELARLTEAAADPGRTVVVAAEPLAHHGALRDLGLALTRENPAVVLGPWTAAQVARLRPGSVGHAEAVLAATAGVPFLVSAALDADAPVDATRVALIERLRRLDQPVLDTLLVCSLDRRLGSDDIAAALRVDAAAAQLLVDHARASGLLEPGQPPTFHRTLHQAVAEIVGAARHHDTEISLLYTQLEMTTLTADLALRMAEHGLRDERLAKALTTLAARHRDDPARAAALYRAASEAGSTQLSTELGDALALTGDCATAARLADDLLGSADPAQRAAAVRIAASVAMHDGDAAAAADLFGWLGPYPDAFIASAAVVVAVATGDVPAARAALDVEDPGPPTSTARAARSLADGLLDTLDRPFPAAIAGLSRSITSEWSLESVSPDSPAALVTLAAIHGGDPVRARSIIGRAAAQSSPFTAPRHRLLLGWTRMLDGRLNRATADATAAGAPGLHRRDALWSAALHTAIARRAGDSGAMQQHWYAALDVLAEYSLDLYSLLPLGELWVAAARLRQVDRLQHHLDEAMGLLERLGRPPLWSVPLHWAGVHAGILANSPDAVAPHGQALTAAAADSAYAQALARAGRAWLRVLANQVDVEEVTPAARGLTQFGLTWDATRLAGQAALQTPDPRVSGVMLQLARELKVSAHDADDVPAVADDTEAAAASAASGTFEEPSRPAGVAPRAAAIPSSRLSDREREVAELLLLGMPYRDIGSQLFISAKTVEHHVARIRRRLGAESRPEMLSMLRALLGTPA
ncbi:isoniazid response ATPase/transcriptional regulator IniR [Mycolicibacterium diernhoferi]|uniref:Helix-turn-helix transcriptional regulator n=1 Tax=Mycolicibacterium diernhoferi TaxID=1801 RepID=A0A1Q4HI02_9MYCO|nr:isoniazid response ATPase/transcriptional regulator IniR [Mycolicibacterium diernhoferi]OJZ67164.1 helix-turn-helix transcriptional regulator [Mycolicibacterium diernhoferi]OPE49824.1 helix-turn-helix transcriptional regulator [Mycolicibacterium diernhoferi]PEG52573.1 helix-turn-helix transcriptional regulator [Mycolicibacterium diernhoferi]QYL23366.1 isoniazid response ATPase/transcriptional regulator IniR [Mycolicibacterium diernhoferi]